MKGLPEKWPRRQPSPLSLRVNNTVMRKERHGNQGKQGRSSKSFWKFRCAFKTIINCKKFSRRQGHKRNTKSMNMCKSIRTGPGDGSAAKSPCCSRRGHWLGSPHPRDASQPPVIPIAEPHSYLPGHQTDTWCIDTHVDHTLRQTDLKTRKLKLIL